MLEGFRASLARRFAPKAAPASRSEGAVLAGLVDRKEPPRRGTAEMPATYRTTPWVRAVVGRIASACGAVEWQALAQTSQRTGKAIRSRALERAQHGKREKMISRLRKSGELREYDNHPMLDLLERGCDMLSGRQALRVTFIHLELHGEAFWALERNGAGMPVGYWPMPPAWVRETATSGEPYFKLEVNGRRTQLPTEDVLYFRDPDPANPYGRGTGVAEALGDEIDTDEYASKFIKTFFYNSALPAAIVSVEGASEPERARLEQSWLGKFRGHWNGNRLLVTNGKVDAKTLESSFKDQQIIDLRKAERDFILQTWGVPPEALGIIENSNRATIDSALYLFAVLVMVPRLDLVRGVLQSKLAPQYDERLVIAYESPVPEDRTFELQAWQANKGAVTRGEWREKWCGLESHGEVDDVYVMALGEIERPIADKPPAPPPPESETPEPEPAEPEPDVEDAEDNDAPEEPEEKSQHRHVTKRLETADIEEILESLRPERLTEPMDDVFRRYIEEWGNEALADLGLSPSFSMLNPIVTEHLSTLSGERITGMTNETTRQAIRDTLTEGVRAGEGVRELAGRVGSVFEEADRVRSVTIARTEVLRSSNFATFTAYSEAGIVERKKWIATPDGRARDTHLELGSRDSIPLHEPFTIGGASAMYPGDFGIAELDIQCRCTMVADVGEPKSAEDLLAVWKAYDRKLVPWEDDATDALRRGFTRQRDDVTAALYEVAG